MRARTIALVGAAIVAAGLILQQLIGFGVAAAVGSRGAQLDQTLLEVLFGIGGLAASIAVPLGAAVTGGGIVLMLAGRGAPAADTVRDAADVDAPATPGARGPEWTQPTDPR